jgi:hypothetical protein
MNVGSNLGQVYKGNQGIQLATVYDRGYIEALMAGQKAAEEAKRKDKVDGMKKTAEALPKDTWHFYQNEVSKDVDALLMEGARLMTDYGINNLWTDTSPEAFEWRNKITALQGGVKNIDQYQDQYDKAIAAIAIREEKYNPNYVNRVKNFPKNHDKSQLMTGDIQFPVPEFINPGDIYSNFYVAESKRYQQTLQAGQPPDSAEIDNLLQMYFSDPSRTHDADAARQMFEQLPQNERDVYADQARRNGLAEPWMAHAKSNFMGMLNTETLDMTAVGVQFAQDASYEQKGSRVTDTSGVTKSSSRTRFSDPSYPEKQAKSYFYKNDYLLDKPDEMKQLGIDLNKVPNRETRRKIAEAAMAQTIRDNAETKSEYGLGRNFGAGSGGIGTDERLRNYDDWRPRLNSDDITVANEAAKWLVDVSGIEGQRPISDAYVRQPTRATIHYKDPNIGDQRFEFGRALVVTYSNQKEADSARAILLKQLYNSDSVKLNQEEEDALTNAYPDDDDAFEQAKQNMLREKNEAYKDYLKELERRSVGNTIEYPLVGGEWEQVFKTMHGVSVAQKKALYETELDGPMPFDEQSNSGTAAPLKPGAPKKQHLSLF